MLTTLPKLVNRSFVLGFVIPTLIGASSVLFLVGDVPGSAAIFATESDSGGFARLTITVLLLWSAAVLLQVFNHQMFRLLEGYWGPFRTKSRLAAKQRAFDRAYQSLSKAEEDCAKAGASDSMKNKYYADLRTFLTTWPPNRDHVLPTRFGNAIRAFESYPYTVYGVDSIPTWLRLSALFPKRFADSIEAARAEVSFFVNIWLMAVLAGGIAAVRTAIDVVQNSGPSRLIFPPLLWDHLSAAVISAVIVYFSYGAAIERARAWGGLVMAGFDLYLPSLAKQLGYKLNRTAEEQKLFWRKLNSSFLYHESMEPADWPVASPETKSDPEFGKDKEESEVEDKAELGTDK
jgi:hypothetical protein